MTASRERAYTRRDCVLSFSLRLSFSLLSFSRVENADLIARARGRKNSRKVHDWRYEYFGDFDEPRRRQRVGRGRRERECVRVRLPARARLTNERKTEKMSVRGTETE